MSGLPARSPRYERPTSGRRVEEIYASNRFWPEPLISINPNFERGASVDDLAADGTLHPDTARVFRVDGHPIRFHRHQDERCVAGFLSGLGQLGVTTGRTQREHNESAYPPKADVAAD